MSLELFCHKTPCESCWLGILTNAHIIFVYNHHLLSCIKIGEFTRCCFHSSEHTLLSFMVLLLFASVACCRQLIMCCACSCVCINFLMNCQRHYCVSWPLAYFSSCEHTPDQFHGRILQNTTKPRLVWFCAILLFVDF